MYMSDILEQKYITPLAKWARVLEIFIPGYMFGKAWGIANATTLELYRVTFPTFLIDMAEKMKGLIVTNSAPLQRLFSTCSGALVGFLVILALGAIMHLVLHDRKYFDSLRFTAITLIPLAVMNGTLTHLTNTIFESLGGGESIESITQSAVDGPRGQIAMYCVFYMLALWMMGKRTGVIGWRRYGVLLVGVGFLAVYFAAGLGITQAEWTVALPKIQAAIAAHAKP
jgi:hypothetical protein